MKEKLRITNTISEYDFDKAGVSDYKDLASLINELCFVAKRLFSLNGELGKEFEGICDNGRKIRQLFISTSWQSEEREADLEPAVASILVGCVDSPVSIDINMFPSKNSFDVYTMSPRIEMRFGKKIVNVR